MAFRGLKYFISCTSLCLFPLAWAQAQKQEVKLDVSNAELLAQRAEPIVLADSGYQPVAVTFDPAFLRGTPYSSININQFEQDQQVIAGRYMADLYVNDRYQGSDEFVFKEFANSERPRLCVNKAIIMQLGLDESYEQTALIAAGDEACVVIRRALPGVKYGRSLILSATPNQFGKVLQHDIPRT